ncbi:uncharacterized protein LOC106668435 [Cimex lectularius]|uniref:Protein sleepless n=1 Tax=Cimex lectularius TaxID=79782 RepID=A0A8I6RZC9_CIMLE|nr:uncharacterized protein LOC106668435 [Cimex lectularius]
MCKFVNIPLFLFFISVFVPSGYTIKCYQCASSETNEDNCGAYEKFDTDRHIAVECNSDESNVPGTFCMKVTEQGQKGFIWDGRWRQVIRRCASVADTGVSGVCNWGVRENGVYWEECYCSTDSCNGSATVSINKMFLITSIFVAIYYTFC